MVGGLLQQPDAKLQGNGLKRSAPPGEVKDTSAYSEFQAARLEYRPSIPPVLKAPFKVVKGTFAEPENPAQLQEIFPNLWGAPSVHIQEDTGDSATKQPLKIGVVLSGGQAAGGHNVIAGIFDYLQFHNPGSILYGFLGGPAGVMNCKCVEITADFLYPYRNQGGFDIICSGRDKIEKPEQFKQAEDTVTKLDLDGLVVIGGDDSNTNAALLAEYFKRKNLKTRVIGCPKTIDGDLKSPEVPTSFGFDTACKVYSEMIGNLMLDARSSGKYYHFVRLMGRAASHIALECALQTHPNLTVIGEEVFHDKQTLWQVTKGIADVVQKRADVGKHYGVILIPEGLIDFIPEVRKLISELNDIISSEEQQCTPDGEWKSRLTEDSCALFEILPLNIQETLLLDRDPHGNVQVSKIEMEKMLIQMVGTDLKHRKAENLYHGKFQGQPHFFGYEGRCGLPTNFDCTYCYTLGFVAGALLSAGQTGLIASVQNVTAPSREWTVGGHALISMMTVERRKGNFKPVIKKAMTELEGAPFLLFKSLREQWGVEDHYRSPGPIQFYGPNKDKSNYSLMLEQASIKSLDEF